MSYKGEKKSINKGSHVEKNSLTLRRLRKQLQVQGQPRQVSKFCLKMKTKWSGDSYSGGGPGLHPIEN